jgi:hypothetical protein
MSPAKQHWMMACSEMVSSIARVVVRAVVLGLELDEEVLLLLDEVLAVVVVLVVVALLVMSPVITSASMSSKSSLAV